MIALSLVFVGVITYCIVRLLEIREKEHELLHHEIEEYAHHMAAKNQASSDKANEGVNLQWRHVLNYLVSPNESDWKLAILEADTMLEELTDKLELDGKNIGEKLKAADKAKFKTLDNAWEAHIVRNKIAHDGAKFELTQREANRIAVLYENVFREFGMI